MTIDNKCTAALLEELSIALKSLNLWQTQVPSRAALSSTSPFCCDTLSFEQWLQFVFIEKIGEMINQGQTLPNKIALTPMAEESFKHLSTKGKALLTVINKIDQTLTGQGE